MAIYRNIQTSFWNDAFIIDRTPEEKLFYLYVMTNPKTSMCGIYEFSIPIACLETGFTKQKIETLLAKFQNDYKRIVYSQSTGEIAIINWMKYNNSNSPKIVTAIENAFEKVKNQDLVKYMKGIDTVSIPYAYPMDTILRARITDTVPNTSSDSSQKTSKTSENEEAFVAYAMGDEELLQALKEFESMRKERKEPLTARAAKIMLTELDKLASDNATKIAIINQSILNNWKGVFALKTQNNNGKPKQMTYEEEIAARTAAAEAYLRGGKG